MNTKTAIFTTTDSTLTDYSGESVEILGAVLAGVDEEVGPMFRVKSGAVEFHAFADELAPVA